MSEPKKQEILTEDIIEMEFDPVTVVVDGNEFVLPNDKTAQDFIDKVKKHKLFGGYQGYEDMLGFDFSYLDTEIDDTDFTSYKTQFYSNADDAFGAWRVI